METRFEARQGQENPALHNFFESFRGAMLKNSKGKIIKLKIRQENTSFTINKNSIPKSDRAAWVIEFENYDPKGPYSEKDLIPQNYVELETYTDTEEININYAKFTDPELLGKGVYEQILKLIAENFPVGWKLTSVIEHPKTRQAILAAKEAYELGSISEEEFLKKVAESNLIEKTIKAGFNSLTFVVAEDSMQTIYETAKKISPGNKPNIQFKRPHE
ncbi:MAG: hypothetical protein JNN11_04100 [Candidatus Doudnabacteria bacterium]|nr:hypothetical protein [Candidatus Doudnabacteria bacterium]